MFWSELPSHFCSTSHHSQSTLLDISLSEAAISMAEKLEVRITRTFNIANGKPAANGVDSSNPSRKVFINDFWTAKKDIKRGGVLQVLATPPQPGKRDWFVITFRFSVCLA